MTVSEDIKKRRRRRRIEAYALSFSILAALLTTAGVVTLAVRSSAAAPYAMTAGMADWLAPVVAKMGDQDYGWLKFGQADSVVTVTGEASTAEIRDAAFEAAETAILAAAPGDVVVVDNVSVRGGPTALGQALASLGPSPTVDDCNAAFAQTLAGRFISFESGSAAISAESGRLLNALTGVAIRCKAWNIEIAGHTDLQGRPRPNLVLSQARAEAVRDFLVARNVTADGLRPIGYGMSRPLAPGRSPEADAQNRRIEFTVSAP
jgi:outer membrane protein OmpA-like peptidoglycan-associated protein